MNTQSIEIGGVEYTVKFGFGANRILAKKWKVKKLSQLGQRIAKHLKFEKDVEPEIDQFIALADLIHSGIMSVQPNAKLTSDDVADFLMANVDQAIQLVHLWGESIPNQESPNPDQREKNVKRVKGSK